MTETAEQAPAAAPAPQLIHSGTYALYRTPTGGYHVVYQRIMAADDDGVVQAVVGAPPQHLRELHERAAHMVAGILDRDTPIPPMIQAVLDGQVPGIKDLMRLRQQAEQHMNGDGNNG